MSTMSKEICGSQYLVDETTVASSDTECVMGPDGKVPGHGVLVCTQAPHHPTQEHRQVVDGKDFRWLVVEREEAAPKSGSLH